MNWEWVKEIPEEKIPEPYRTILVEISPEAMIKFAQLFQGMPVYFPKLDSLLQEIRNEKIKKEFNGSNYRELGRKYNLTEVWIRNIVAQKHNENQMSIFDIAQ